MKKIVSFVMALFLLVTCAAQPAFAEEKGKLGKFEEQIDKPDESESTTSSTSSYTAKDLATQSILDILLQFFMMGLTSTGIEDFSELYKELKREWHPVMPTIRAEPSYQYVYKNMTGFSGKAEAGYLILGVDGEYTRYFEKQPKSDLTMINGHFLLRTMFTKHFGTNLALGVKNFRGLTSHTGFEFGFPFYIYLNNSFYFDVLPYMSFFKNMKNVYDIGGGFSYKYKFIGARVGYRALFVSGERIHGPRVGIFVQY